MSSALLETETHMEFWKWVSHPEQGQPLIQRKRISLQSKTSLNLTLPPLGVLFFVSRGDPSEMVTGGNNGQTTK